MYHSKQHLETLSLDQQSHLISNEIHNPYSKAFLSPLLTGHLNILDLACGTGSMTIWMAKQLGTSGFVTGVDINEASILEARDSAKRQGITNIEFKVISAYDIAQMGEIFDLVYQRHLLIHLTNPDAVLRAIAGCLKPGGVIACESTIYSHCFSDPPTASYDHLIKLIKLLYTAQGKDFDIGKTIYSRLLQNNFNEIDMQFRQPTMITEREKMLATVELHRIEQLLIQEQVAHPNDIKTLISEIEVERAISDSVWTGASMCQISGVKK